MTNALECNLLNRRQAWGLSGSGFTHRWLAEVLSSCGTLGAGLTQRSRLKVILHVRGNYKGHLLDHDLAFIVLMTDQFQLVVGWKEIASHLPIRGILMCGDAATLPQV